ncbi:MAG: hypothetical protein BV459_00570 [Thermoplasmata archaeon M11B2D]|nr:MAG: hypothetical protein BV459_00570 [Thermoplasmata archaeon M11B2D]
MDALKTEQLFVREFTKFLMEATEDKPDFTGKYFDYWMDKTTEANGPVADGEVQNAILVSAEGEYSSGTAGTVLMVRLDEPPKTVYRVGSMDYKDQSSAVRAVIDKHEESTEQRMKDDTKAIESDTYVAYNAKTFKIVSAMAKGKPITELEGKLQSDASKQKDEIMKKYSLSDLPIVPVLNKSPIYRAA